MQIATSDTFTTDYQFAGHSARQQSHRRVYNIQLVVGQRAANDRRVIVTLNLVVCSIYGTFGVAAAVIEFVGGLPDS